MRTSRLLLALALLAGLLTAACGSAAFPSGGPLRVVATTTIVGDIVAQVGGDYIDLQVLLPVGIDPHSFEPSPQDVVLIAEADLIFTNGLGLEEFMTNLLDNAGGDARAVALSDGVTTRTFADEHGEQGADPHVWMDPENMVIWVENIAAALSELDPANTAAYWANAAAYQDELNALDSWIRDQVSTLEPSQRVLVTDHDSLGYFADAYGFEVVGAIIPSFSTQASPSAGDLADLEARIGQYDAPAIFIGADVNPAMAEQIGADLGVQVVPLYTGSLSAADGPAASYLDFMHYNVEAIVGALGGAR